MTIPLNVKEIKKLKQKGIEIRPHNMNTSISYEVVLSLKGVQALLSYINNQRLPKIGNRLDFEFFSAFIVDNILLPLSLKVNISTWFTWDLTHHNE